MTRITINKNQNAGITSCNYPVNPGKCYETTAGIVGLRGTPYCAYFALIFLDGKGKEIIRRIRWLNDFTGTPVGYRIVAVAPEAAEGAVLAFRFNMEEAISSEGDFAVPDIADIPLRAAEEAQESYDALNDFLKEKDERKGFIPLTVEQEDIIERNMVWIFCAPRSGSTWLARQLLCHPEHVTWDEPLIGIHMGASQRQNKELLRIYDSAIKSTQYFFLPYFESAWLPFLRSMILNRCYAQFPNALQKTIVIKEPWGSLGADLIMRCLPRAKMLFLSRDGRDVIDSYIDMNRPDSWVAREWSKLMQPINDENERRSLIDIYCHNWSLVTRITLEAYGSHDAALRLSIRYEDLRHDTLSELRKIYSFVGTDVPDDFLKALVEKFSFENIPKEYKGPGKFTRKAQPGGWKTAFSKDEMLLMHEVMGGLLKRLGYDVGPI